MLSPNSILPTLRLIALSFRKKEFGARVENVRICVCVCVCVCVCAFLGALAKFRKTTISFFTGRIFTKFGI
jgi:hypothetical protein